MFLDSVFSFIILLLLSFAIYKLAGLKAELSPFVALCTILCTVTIFALFNLMNLGLGLCYGAAAVLFVLGVKKSKGNLKQDIKDFLSPGVIFFILSCALMFVILALQKPILSQWDEFSFWGTSQKLTKYHGAIYSFYESSLIGRTTPPSLAILSTFFQPMGQGYLEWKAFFAYDVLLFSSFAAWTAGVKREKWHCAFMVYLFGFLTPFIFEVYTKIVYLAPMYISVMADIPLGVVFGGAVAVYLFGKKEGVGQNNNHILALVPVLMMFTQMKDMGFAFSLIVIFIIFFDMVFVQKDFAFLGVKGFLGKLVAAVALGVSVIASFLSWTVHMGLVMSENRFELGGDRQMGMAEMLITGVKELLSPEKSEKFIDMQSEMLTALWTKPISMFGSGVRVLFVIAVLFIIAGLLAKRKSDIIRIASLYVTSAVGFVAYYIFHIFIYVYIFKANAYGLPSYERYIYPYYIAWLAFGVMALCISAGNCRAPRVATGALFAFILSVFGLFNYMVSYENTFILYSGADNSAIKNVMATASTLKESIEPEDRIFCYSAAEDSGQRWFLYTYELAPNFILRDLGWFQDEGMTEQQYSDEWRKRMLEYLKEHQITHFLLDYGSDNLQRAFGEELGCDVNNYGLLNAAYYKINYLGEDDIAFELIKIGRIEQ
ncbi:MAG: hypothetical protein RR827_02345 [Oscillospiraceae bacterium]